jgi:hypothetical protein
MYCKGLEMLKIFKNHTLKTSLLDDFMYYENRQKIMQDEKARLLIRSFESPLFLPALEAPRKLNFVVDKLPSKYEKNSKLKDDSDSLNQMPISSSEQNIHNSDVPNIKSVNEQAEKTAVDEDISSILKIGSVTITPKKVETKQSGIGNREQFDVLTVGSMPVKVNGFAGSSGFLKVGSIQLDPKTLQP